MDYFLIFALFAVVLGVLSMILIGDPRIRKKRINQEPRNASWEEIMWIHRSAEESLVRFESEHHIRVSPWARRLIFSTLHAIQEDPSPHWRERDPVTLREQSSRIVQEIPEMILEISRQESITHEITYFDVLHYLTFKIDDICPFSKR